jgi:DNA gyrase subunit A
MVDVQHRFYALETNGESAIKLAKNIKLIDKRKRERVQRIITSPKRDIGSQYDIIPYAGEKIFGELSKHHNGGGWYKDVNGNKFRAGIKYLGGCKIRYSKDLREKPLRKSQIIRLGIEDKLERIGSNLCNFLEDVGNDLLFLRVLSVEEVEPQKTYDIEVEGDHEFIANGMISHNCLGKYHPHGDMALYDALVRMAQDFSMRYPLIEGQGNFGSIDGDPPAAMRYSEARLARISDQMLCDLEKETVRWNPNFDNSLQEPQILPAKLPNLLVNGSGGIAVGMVTNIPPHNLNEIVDGIRLLIDKPETSLQELLQVIKGPDFPTGGIIWGKKGIEEAYSTGRGLIYVRAKTQIEKKGERKRIVVTELPYQVNKASLLKQIAELVKKKRLTGITDLRDESDRRGLRIVIPLKRDTNEEIVLNQLFKHTPLQSTFGVINLALLNGEPRLLSLKAMLNQYIKHRIEILTKATSFDLRKSEERLHVVKGLIKASENLGGVIELIRKSESAQVAKAQLIKAFDLSSIQASEILSLRLQQLTSLEIEKIKKEEKELGKEILQFKRILADEAEIKNIIKKEISELKKRFGDKRRTEILDLAEEQMELSLEELIPDYKVICTITNEGYIKRIPLSTYRLQRRGGKGLLGMERKVEDWIKDFFIASTHDWIMFFTKKGKVYWLKCYRIPESARHAKGRPIINLLPRIGTDQITAMIPTQEFDPNHYLIFATKKGIVKKTRLSAFAHVRANGIRAIRLKNDEVIAVDYSKDEEEIMLASANGQATYFNEKELRPLSRATYGVRGIKLREGDKVISMIIGKDVDVLTITENGYGKRTPVSKYRKTHRGSKGVRTIITNERNGKVIAIKGVKPDDEIILTTLMGMVERIPVNGVRLQGRNTQGVRLIRLKKGDKVISVT